MSVLKIFLILMLISIAVASFWNHIPLIKEGVHSLLDPTFGKMLDIDITKGMIFITLILTFATSLLQKYTVDNEELKRLKEEQKKLQKDIKKVEHDPKKMLEIQSKLTGEIMRLSLRPTIYTMIPFILLIRWFQDYFSTFETHVKILGFFSWFWAYFLFTIIFSMIFRKILKLP